MPLCCFRKPQVQVKFDTKSFCDHVYYIGRPYRHRAIELIKLCQLFSVASKQSFSQHTNLLSVIQECDKAISYAITSRSGKEESQEADDKFDEAIRRLRDYESEFHLGHESVDKRMGVATENDKKKKDKARDRSNDDTLNVVEFHILKSLPCQDPVIVRQALHSRADIKDLPEILWNFSHFEGEQCLTLVQNPHFYENLPMSPDAYVGTFKGECIENRLPDKIFVPTNSSRRVYFDFTGNQRVFDVWKTTNSALIFKDIRGNLQGETIVESSTIPRAPHFQYCREHTQGPLESVEVEDTHDWKDLIRTGTADDTTRTHICIRPGS